MRCRACKDCGGLLTCDNGNCRECGARAPGDNPFCCQCAKIKGLCEDCNRPLDWDKDCTCVNGDEYYCPTCHRRVDVHDCKVCNP